MKFPLSYEATITRQDFVRLLAQATGDDNFHNVDSGFRGKGWSVRLSPIPPLEIGMVKLERHRVEIGFEGWSTEDQDRFMQRFTQHYQRGGG